VGIATTAIHAGQSPDPTTGSLITPIHATSTYSQTVQAGEPGEVRFDYARTINPTRLALEANIAALEGARFGRAFASGMAAIDCVLRTLSAGDHVICGSNVYGGTYRLFERVLARQGLVFSHVDTSDVDAVKEALRPSTRLIHLETPTNPMMLLTDIAAIAGVARAARVRLMVDNTFMSPVLQRPLELGADVVVHSTTKFLNGHSDSVGGVVVTSDEALDQELGFLQNSAGAIMSPFEAWLVLRGTKTLVARMRQHEESGRRVAAFIAGHAKVRRTYYPGLPSHPHRALAEKQMKGFGSMVSFEVGESVEQARRFLKALRLCTVAESLGGVETLISHPASMTHGSIPADRRLALGITPGLVRISVGLEDVEDIVEDLDRGFGVL
jgi:cystathionine gamma-lyase/cystathionine beta-lyase/cystathionine gamma-lyase/homocysteine desulfhydrase